MELDTCKIINHEVGTLNFSGVMMYKWVTIRTLLSLPSNTSLLRLMRSYGIARLHKDHTIVYAPPLKADTLWMDKEVLCALLAEMVNSVEVHHRNKVVAPAMLRSIRTLQ